MNLVKHMCNTKALILLLFLISVIEFSVAQSINAEQLIKASIQYHDPDSHWKTFSDTLIIEMTSPQQTPRVSKVYINNLKNDFYLEVEKDNAVSSYSIKSDKCELKLNGKSDFSATEVKKFNLTCERGKMLKNYYTYLYGMPIKIMDPGTIITNKVEEKIFQGKDYLVLKVSYTPEVGGDIWFFYFNPKTFALEVYQFFKTDDSRQLIEGSGEYIVLSEETEIGGIKMPKIRKWYHNKNDSYLGTDSLLN